MDINSVTNELHNNTRIKNPKYEQTQVEKKNKSSSRDTLEISSEAPSEAYTAQSESKDLSATSGKDKLGITTGSDRNTFVIHFYDSAMVSRAIARGYITVNGTRIDLSEETKQQLAEVDKKAASDREKAFNEHLMKYEIAVAQQQSEVWQEALKEAFEAIEIAAKISKGKKVTNEEVKKLMHFSPEMYAMAISAASSVKHKDQQESIQPTETKDNDEEEDTIGVEWSQFECKTYDSQMTVSMGKSVEIKGISEGEIIINGGTHA